MDDIEMLRGMIGSAKALVTSRRWHLDGSRGSDRRRAESGPVQARSIRRLLARNEMRREIVAAQIRDRRRQDQGRAMPATRALAKLVE